MTPESPSMSDYDIPSMLRPSRLAPLFFLVALSACSSVVTGGPSDAAVDTPSPDAGSCALPNGTRCPRGTSCPAGDGCNTCSCIGDSDVAGCTLIGCVVPDAGPRRCLLNSDCGGSEVCLFSSPGCGVAGTCDSPRDCAFLGEYCGCDGVTFSDCAGGSVGHAYVSAGACPATDGGTPGQCNGASIGPDGRSCVGPTDGPLPDDCCTWSCDIRLSTCNSLPPTCPAGRVATVVSPGCWGPCVAPTSCAPMMCSSDRTCAAPWRCDLATLRCVYGG